MSEQPAIHHEPGSVPEPDDLQAVFQRHYANSAGMSDHDAYRDLRSEESIRRQYTARVLFELLQNALDRAESNVSVEIRDINWGPADQALIVANDGPPISMDPEYDYSDLQDVQGQSRPDFNALCSLHVSNKRPEESVGNKGIGFRSVFWLGDFARVWSRFSESPGWWGMEMHLPLDHDTWQQRLKFPEVQKGHTEFLGSTTSQLRSGERRASFHFPLPLCTDDPPTPDDVSDFSTVVVVPMTPGKEDELRESVETFQQRHLNFIGLFDDRRELTVSFDAWGNRFQKSTWPSTNPKEAKRSIVYWESSELQSLAEEAEHDVSTPGAAIAWPRPEASSDGSKSGLYGYLPTLIGTPFGIDLQGDFQLQTDRTALRLDDETIGRYNRALLRVAAELHLHTIFDHLGIPDDDFEYTWIDPEAATTVPQTIFGGTSRDDFWQFLDPGSRSSDAAKIVVDHIDDLLFSDAGVKDPDRYRQWAALADAFFEQQDQWPLATYDDFWKAAGNWLDRTCKSSRRTKTWRRRAIAMCDAIRDVGTRVAPITATRDEDRTSQTPAVQLPERGTAGGQIQTDRHTHRLFIRRSETTQLDLPLALREAGRAVTSYEFPSGFDREPPHPLGANQFNRWDVLAELRQLPNDLTDWEYKPLDIDTGRAERLQSELIRFTMELFALNSQGSAAPPAETDAYGPEWRAIRDDIYSDNARSAGRAIATLFLPTIDGQWEPARQLTRDRVAVEKLPPLPENADIDSFLAFIGVTPKPPDPEEGVRLTLVEGGEDGTVAPRDVPPVLVAAGTEWNPLRLGIEPATADSVDPAAWLMSLDAAWDTWLADIIEAERNELDEQKQGRRPIEILPVLRNQAWFPVGDAEGAAKPPLLVEDPPDRISPAELTLVSRQQRQFPSVLWSVSKEAPISQELLIALDSVSGTDMDSLGRNGAEPAFRLLTQVHSLTADRLDEIEEHPRARQALTRLFDRILNTISREHDPETDDRETPILGYRPVDEPRALAERGLAWYAQDENVWVPTTNTARDQMRRFFPTVPLAAATIGTETLRGYEPLAAREVEISRQVFPVHRGSEEVEVVQNLEEQLRPIIAHLLALASTTNQIDIDPATAADRWRSSTIRYVENAWIEFQASLDGGEPLTATRYKDTHNHALYLQPDPPTIIFDTPDETTGTPPLDEFGEPLAKLLLEDSATGVGPLFGQALSGYDSDDVSRVERLLKKRDAISLVDAYERHLRQLDDEEHEQLRRRVRAALSELDIQIRDSWNRLSHIDPDDVDVSTVSWTLTAGELNAALRSIDLTDAQEPFRPQFSCEQTHRAEWNAWFADWDQRLIPFLEYLVEEHTEIIFSGDELEGRLQEYITEDASRRVAFDPTRAVIEWLRGNPFGESLPEVAIPAPEELEDQLIEFSPRYEPVENVATTEDLGWTRPSLSEGDPNETENGIVEIEDLESEWKNTKSVGDEAERAAASWIAKQTVELLEDAKVRGEFDEALESLLSVIPSSGRTAENLDHGLREWNETGSVEALESGLHVSSVWDGAGYDMLGLERTGDEIEPVRYEIKSLGDEGPYKVHLTRNQLRVYRKVLHSSKTDDTEQTLYQGLWRLFGVQSGRQAVDLTDELDGLPKLVNSFRNQGYGHDGLVIYVQDSDESVDI